MSATPPPPKATNSTAHYSPLEVYLGFTCLALVFLLVFGALVAFFLKDRVDWTQYFPFMKRFQRQPQVVFGAPLDVSLPPPQSDPGGAPSSPGSPGVEKAGLPKNSQNGGKVAKKGSKKKKPKSAKQKGPASPPSVANLPHDQQP